MKKLLSLCLAILMLFSLCACGDNIQTDDSKKTAYDAASNAYDSINSAYILIEMGSEANTLGEAIYSGQLLGKQLGEILNSLKET